MLKVLSFLLFLPLSCFSQIDFKKIFQDRNVTGSITIYDYKNKTWTYSDEADSKVATKPASTFKIMNTLIALELGVIKDENEIIKFVGIENVDTASYGNRTEIFKDMNAAEALAKSAVWVHLEFAKKIGRENYKKYLTACHYGNIDFSEPGIDFWNNGPFAITPLEEINFIKALYENKLPFSKRTMNIVKKIMLTETGTDYTIRAKTGMGILDTESIGWWVGYLEKKGKVYFFATRVRTPSIEFKTTFAANRKEVTKEVFRQMKIID